MEIKVKRNVSDGSCTLGEMLLEGVHECFTLELPIGLGSNYGKPGYAITSGRYRLVITYSPHFARMLPEVLNVPFRSSIRIHSGNSAKDTEGCTLVGQTLGKDEILNSKVEIDSFILKLQAILNIGAEIWITYEDSTS